MISRTQLRDITPLKRYGDWKASHFRKKWNALNSILFMITNNNLCSKKLLGGSERMMPKAMQLRLTMDMMTDITPGGENLP